MTRNETQLAPLFAAKRKVKKQEAKHRFTCKADVCHKYCLLAQSKTRTVWLLCEFRFWKIAECRGRAWGTVNEFAGVRAFYPR